MSVSFFAEISEEAIIPAVLECGCGAWRSEGFASTALAYSALEAGSVISACSDEYCYGLFVVSTLDEPEVNISNHNTAEILDNLGIQVGEEFCERCSGSLPAEDLKGRILMALALLPEDEGMPSYRLDSVAGFGGALEVLGNGVQVWQSARPAGYAQEVLGRLLGVAEFALSQGRAVVWA